MKLKDLLVVSLFFLIKVCFAQSELTSPKTDCKYVLAWTCNECTFNWTGDCIDKLPSGNGILTVYLEEEEIMRYEGDMKNGKFEGSGSYRDGMNQFEGEFENGSFVDNNPHALRRKAMIDTTAFNKTKDWELKPTITKQIDNLYFTFPADGYAFDNRDLLVKKCIDAIEENCQLINDTSYTEFTRIRFVKSKEEMLLHADLYVGGGMVNIWTRSIFMMATNESKNEEENLTNPPIKHEMMHMVSLTEWGMPPSNNTWLNEGLATYAANDCSGYSVAEIYRYFLEADLLISIDSLTNNFYQTAEMIGYHQAGYIVEYMITNYGIPKFEKLWKNGFSSFETIYGFPYSQLEKDLNKHIVELYPVPPAIDWEILRKGCKK
jgi:hypothetical protein